MTSGRTIQTCPKCGGTLESALDPQTGNRGIRCWRTTCLFNFLDQQCHRCGGSVVEARRFDVGKYKVQCANLHDWEC